MLALRIRSLRGVHWLAFFGGVLVCWVLLFSMAIPSDLRALEATYGEPFIEMLCGGALGASGFVGGTMNLGFMGLAMVLMTFEKLPDIGRHLTKPLGAILIASGLALPLF